MIACCLRERCVAIHIELDTPLIGLRHRHLRFRLCQLRARLLQLALRLRQPALGLIQCGLEGAGIDLEQQLAAPHERALGVGLLIR